MKPSGLVGSALPVVLLLVAGSVWLLQATRSAQARSSAPAPRFEIREQFNDLNNQTWFIAEAPQEKSLPGNDPAVLRLTCENNQTSAELDLPVWVLAEANFNEPTDAISLRTVQWSFDSRKPVRERWRESYRSSGSLLTTASPANFLAELERSRKLVIEFTTPAGKQSIAFDAGKLHSLLADPRWSCTNRK
jgi:hypothetical protein